MRKPVGAAVRQYPAAADGDRHLLGRAAAGDSRAFETLVERHADRVFGLTLHLLGDRQLAEEVTQDTFLRLSQSVETLRVERTIAGWLRTVAVNLCRDAWRRQRSRPAHGFADDLTTLEVVDRAPNPEQRAQIREALGLAEEALLMLPEQQRLAVVLRYVWNCSYAEIAETQQCSEGTVASRLHRGLQAFAEAMETIGVD